jgi:hypothetical protein
MEGWVDLEDLVTALEKDVDKIDLDSDPKAVEELDRVLSKLIDDLSEPARPIEMLWMKSGWLLDGVMSAFGNFAGIALGDMISRGTPAAPKKPRPGGAGRNTPVPKEVANRLIDIRERLRARQAGEDGERKDS